MVLHQQSVSLSLSDFVEGYDCYAHVYMATKSVVRVLFLWSVDEELCAQFTTKCI